MNEGLLELSDFRNRSEDPKKIPWENSNCFIQNQKQLSFCGNIRGIISTTDNTHRQINFSSFKIF